MFCQVIVDIVHENVAKPFTYLIPEGMELAPGQRVAVPFGHMEKEGIVERRRGEKDARQMIVSLTRKGRELQDKLSDVPYEIGGAVTCGSVNAETAEDVFRTLDDIIDKLNRKES